MWDDVETEKVKEDNVPWIRRPRNEFSMAAAMKIESNGPNNQQIQTRSMPFSMFRRWQCKNKNKSPQVPWNEVERFHFLTNQIWSRNRNRLDQVMTSKKKLREKKNRHKKSRVDDT